LAGNSGFRREQVEAQSRRYTFCRDFYKGLNPEALQNLRCVAQERQCAAERRIFGEGDLGDGVHVIRDGLVEIVHPANLRKHRVFSRLGPGGIFRKNGRD
jgi:CRP-like cAMP-binding protein